MTFISYLCIVIPRFWDRLYRIFFDLVDSNILVLCFICFFMRTFLFFKNQFNFKQLINKEIIMSSAVSSNLPGISATLVFEKPNGLKIVYIGKKTLKFTNRALKTEEAYTLYEAKKTTHHIRKKIELGRMAVLRFENNQLKGILFHPKLALTSEISKFILYTKNLTTNEPGTVIINNTTIGKLNEEQYRKLASQLID